MHKLSLKTLVKRYKYYSKHGMHTVAERYGAEIERRSEQMRDAEHEYYKIMAKYEMKDAKSKK